MKNGALESRLQRSFYDEFAAQLREGGIDDEEIESVIANIIAEVQSIARGLCPDCGAPVRRIVDRERQQGDSKVPGTWVSYRCSTQPPIGVPRDPQKCCMFAVDLIEGPASN